MRNYFVYMPENRLCAMWGCTASSAGYTRIPPHSIYPPSRHPEDHHFIWERGRILQAYQIVLISEGQGSLEYGTNREKCAIEAGSLFLLFPGIWHRYSPDPERGWTEHWVECRGPAFDAARDGGFLRINSPVYPADDEFSRTFAIIHRLATENALGNQPQLSTLGLQLLALLCRPFDSSASAAEKLVQQAKILILEHYSEAICMEKLARELGISYSRFRQLFRKQTGTSPKQYLISLRIERACDLIANTDKSFKEIAALLGFNSPFHFTNQFRQIIGVSPRGWRHDLRRGLPG